MIDLQKGASAARIVKTIVEAGGEVEEVRRGLATLEEVFLALMEREP